MDTSGQPAAPAADTTQQPASGAPASPAAGSAPNNGAPSGGQPAVGADGKVDLIALLGDVGKEKTFEKFAGKGVADLGKAFIEQEKRLGEMHSKVDAFKVPEKAEDYGFKKPDNLPEGMEYDEAHALKWANAFKEMGVPPAMANKLRDAFFAEQMESHGASAGAVAEANKRLDENYTKVFGDQKGAVVQRVKDVLTKAVPDAAVRADLEKSLPNEALMAIGMIDAHYRKTYGQADTNTGDGDGKPAGKSLDEMRQDAQKLMASDAYRDTMHKDHKSTRATVDQAYKDIAALTDAAKKK